MKPFPWKCGTCRERAVVPATLPTYATDMEHDGRSYPITLTDFRVNKCELCGAVMLDDTAMRVLSDELRRTVGLLSPGQIRQHREALGLTQKELAGYLQIAESTLSRWETGAQIQQRCMDRFLRGCFEVEQLRRFLGMSSGVAVFTPIYQSAARTAVALGEEQAARRRLLPPGTVLTAADLARIEAEDEAACRPVEEFS